MPVGTRPANAWRKVSIFALLSFCLEFWIFERAQTRALSIARFLPPDIIIHFVQFFILAPSRPFLLSTGLGEAQG